MGTRRLLAAGGLAIPANNLRVGVRGAGKPGAIDTCINDLTSAKLKSAGKKYLDKLRKHRRRPRAPS